MNSLLAFHDSFLPAINFLAATELPEPSMLASWGAKLWSIALVVLGLGFVIFVHELGHFLAAKTFGVKCDKFYVGFDVPIRIGPLRLPAKLFHFKWGETEYGIGAIPLGGYVKMLGQNDDPRQAEEEAKRIREEAEGGSLQLNDQGLDPRSYPAKPVYARMVIISAGVIMNLIFGAIFAAGAFMWGVPYQPCVVGGVIPGDPAWVNGVVPGDQITSVSTSREPTDELRFDDMRQEVAMHGIENPEVPLPITLNRNGSQMSVPIVGSIINDNDKPLMTIGILSASTTKITDDRVFVPGLEFDAKRHPDAIQLPSLNLGETIIAIDGESLPEFGKQGAPGAFELHRRLDSKFDQTVKITVREPSKDGNPGATREVEWAPLPRKTLGIQFAVGPVAQIQKGSAAEKQKVGITDRLVSLNGEPINDSATLHLAVAKLAGQKATLKLMRMNKDVEELYDFSWQVPTDFVFAETAGRAIAITGYELPGSGIVVSVLRDVAGIDAGSVAEQAGMKAGDSLRQIQIAQEQDPEITKLFSEKFKAGKALYQAQALDALHNAIYVNETIQRLPVGTKITVEFERNGKIEDATLAVAVDSQWMSPDRGIMFSPMSAIYAESSPVTALGLGVQEVGRQMKNVVRFLYLLVTNKVNVKMLGGPGMIVLAATHEADEGPTRLLLFLTMLSANLAIINFLPIPALDGGHMMFLTAEALRGKPIDENLQMKLTMGGVFALLSLMLFVIVNDVLNITKMFS